MSTTHPANINVAAALAEAQEQYRARHPKSLALHEEACAALPGGNTRHSIYADPFPLTMVRATAPICGTPTATNTSIFSANSPPACSAIRTP